MTNPTNTTEEWKKRLHDLYGFNNDNVLNVRDAENLIADLLASQKHTLAERVRDLEVEDNESGKFARKGWNAAIKRCLELIEEA